MAQTKGATLRPKQHIPEDVRTTGKDEAARYIKEHVIGEGRWPMPFSEIADESGWSRQHIANTIEDYFDEGGDVSDPDTRHPRQFNLAVEVPTDVDDENAYLRGYVQGVMDNHE